MNQSPINEDTITTVLTYIRGGEHTWSQGMTTRPNLTSGAWVHQICLELEKRGLIYRKSDTPSNVVWFAS
jgi:hypothetical protein